MKKNQRHTLALWYWLAALLPLFASCIDEDLSKCGKDYGINYSLKLETQLHAHLQTELHLEQEQTIAKELEKTLQSIYHNKAHDIRLAFFCNKQLYHTEEHIINASQSQLTLYLRAQNYLHIATANVNIEDAITMKGVDHQDNYRWELTEGDTAHSHHHALFTATLPIRVSDQNAHYNVNLNMQNCTAALVIDRRQLHPQSIEGYVNGMGTGIQLNDSCFLHEYPVVMRTEKVEAGQHTALHTTGFPTAQTTVRSTAQALWNYEVYVNLNGKTTKTTLRVEKPLLAGQLTILKGHLKPDGSVACEAPHVGVSVELDWKPGGNHDIEI